MEVGARAQGFLSDRRVSRVVALPLPPVGSGTEPGQKPRRRVVWRGWSGWPLRMQPSEVARDENALTL